MLASCYKCLSLYRYVSEKFTKYVKGELKLVFEKCLSQSELKHTREHAFATHAQKGMKYKVRGGKVWLPKYAPCQCIQIMKKVEKLVVEKHYPQLKEMTLLDSKTQSNTQGRTVTEYSVLKWGNCKNTGQDLHWDIAKTFINGSNEVFKNSCGPGNVDVQALCDIVINCELFVKQCNKYGPRNIAYKVWKKNTHHT